METVAEDRPYRRRVLRGTIATVVGNGWAMAVGFATLPLLLSGLGTEAFGIWALLQTFAVSTGWLSLGDLGLTTSTVRFVATHAGTGDRPSTARVAGTALALFGLLGALWGGVLALVGPRVLPGLFGVPDGLIPEVQVAIFWFSIQVVGDFILQGALALFEGVQAIDRSRALEMFRRTLVTGGSAVAAATGHGLVGAAVAAVAGTVVSLVVTGVAIHRSADLRLGRPEIASVRLLTSYGSRVAVLRPLGVLHRSMDRLVVGAVLGPSAVALVEIATQLQNGAAAVLGATSYAVTPSSAWLYVRGDHARLRELVEVGTRYTLLATLPVVVITALLADPTIVLWVGADYNAAVPLVVLAVAYIAVVAPLQVGCNLLVGTGQVAPVLRASTVSLAVNLAFSVVLVVSFGTVGVFVATLLSALALVPLLGRATLAVAGLGAVSFLRSVVLPPVGAASVLALAVAVPVALPLAPLPTIALGLAVAVVTYPWATTRLALDPGELRGLLTGLRSPVVAATAE